MRKTLTILDFSTGKVHVYYYFADTKKDAEELVEQAGHKLKDCQYMCTDTLNLKIHPKTLKR